MPASAFAVARAEEMALETSRILFELIQEKGGRKKHIFEARLREGQSVRKI